MSSSRVHCTLTGACQPIALRDRDRLGDDVGIGDRPAAEAAAGHHHVQLAPAPASIPAMPAAIAW